jgi:hypothetical protein
MDQLLVSNLHLSVPVAALKVETRVRAKNLASFSLKVDAGSATSASSLTTPHRVEVDLVRTTILTAVQEDNYV